jgi:hypothetical protein
VATRQTFYQVSPPGSICAGLSAFPAWSSKRGQVQGFVYATSPKHDAGNENDNRSRTSLRLSIGTHPRWLSSLCARTLSWEPGIADRIRWYGGAISLNYSHFKGPARIVSLSLAIQSDVHFDAHMSHSDPLILKSFFLVAHPSARIFEYDQWRCSHNTPEAVDLNTVWVQIGFAKVLTDPI